MIICQVVYKDRVIFIGSADEVDELITHILTDNHSNSKEDQTRILDTNYTNEKSEKPFPNISINGLMGMASFTDDKEIVRKEFKFLKSLFDQLQTKNDKLKTLSMGMSADYKIAIEEGSNMVRIGSLLFGKRI